MTSAPSAILDRAAELGLIVLSHSGLDVGFPGVVHVTPRMVRSALDQVGPMTLILAHMGGWRNWDQVEELLPDTSVYLDTSYSLGDLAPLDDGFYLPEDLPMMPQEQFLRMVRTFGPHRILFGTDSPWQSQTDAVAAIRACPSARRNRTASWRERPKAAELPEYVNTARLSKKRRSHFSRRIPFYSVARRRRNSLREVF
mgnify:CR=1 FL=1